MCGIFSVIGTQMHQAECAHIFQRSRDRGRDAWGINLFTGNQVHPLIVRFTSSRLGLDYIPAITNNARKARSLIGAWRAEPTTEIVEDRAADANVAPFQTPGGWYFVHNGTIANDRQLLEDLQRYRGRGYYRPEGEWIDSKVIGVCLDTMTEELVHLSTAFKAAIDMLQGSFAILAVHESHPDTVWYACNYQPLYTFTDPHKLVTYVAAQPEYLPITKHEHMFRPVRVPAYSWGRIEPTGLVVIGSLYRLPVGSSKRVLAICSAGIDSTTAAIVFKRRGFDVTLLHLDYNCKAGEAEMLALKNIAEHEEMPYKIVKTDFFTVAANASTLTDPNRDVGRTRDGEEGAEFAIDWVPARNTVMLALATAYAEANNFGIITCGFNLEEQAAFPDNSVELINTWNRGMPWMVADGKYIRVTSPTINKMKHEIVAMGMELEVPYHLTVSCYTPHVVNGEIISCGHCGPCINSQRAFRMNDTEDPRRYGQGDE